MKQGAFEIGERVLAFILILVLLSTSAQALGLAHEYLADGTLKVAPGETRHFKLILQNEEDRDVTVNVSVDSEIATLVGGGIVEVPANTFENFIYIKIEVPEEAEPGSMYSIPYSVGPVPVEEQEGQVPFSVNYDRKLEVEVTGDEVQETAPEPPEDVEGVLAEEQTFWDKNTNILIAILVIALLMLFYWKREEIASAVAAREKETMEVKSGEEHDYFETATGEKLKGIVDLYHALKDMDEETFKQHVSQGKNDFKKWVKESLGYEGLAERLKGKDRQGMIKVIEDELR